MKKKAILTLLVLGATTLSLGGCNNKEESFEADLRTADEFLLGIDYVNVNWEAFQYTYDWANLENEEGEAMERVITLTEKNFYPYGSQIETWWNVRNLEPTGNGNTEAFYFTDGYGFEPASGTYWTYGDTYDDAVDYYLDGIDLQIAWEYSEGYEYADAIDLEYTDKVLTGATFHHYAVTEGVGYVNDSYTYRTDKTGRLTQYVYETLTHVEQEYQGELVTLDIYAKHDLGEIPTEDVIVPDFNSDEYTKEDGDDNDGYDTTVPGIEGGTEGDSHDLTEEQAEAFFNTVDLNAMYNWTGYAYDRGGAAEGGLEYVEYIANCENGLYGFIEDYSGSIGAGSLTEAVYYQGGYQYEYAPASQGEAEEIGQATAATTTFNDLIDEQIYNIKYYHDYTLGSQLSVNKDWMTLAKADITEFDEGGYKVEIFYYFDFAANDYIHDEFTYYFDDSNSITGFTFSNISTGDSSLTVTLYEIDENTVTENLPSWVSKLNIVS
ncbi:MAG: hypothetical protein LUD22_00290 [Coprobacillus sp.]|nr:hypothetical protein [Coprobacillus sp.]